MPPTCRGKAGGARSEVVVEYLKQFSGYGYTSVLLALAAHVQQAAVFGSANVTNVGVEEFVCP
jgi:hypothetical protein